ncbi:hypothetical protein [Legionella maioricensis]|uniref:Zinc resistance-associated protein n=1 Tax=Legionella maioricensis TaxID=2896528 RepID=A0A9X2D3B5_9GAMM|nr:hypothetical protein [Legionella maioricensis]MCL9685651.1 hypothetical protein [Legionella maioricensis]MCL9689060.1 hypothetical protein [Legionella maioricensis]
MAIKRFLLINTLAIALGASSLAAAQPSSEKIINLSAPPAHAHPHPFDGMLSQEQKAELQNYMKAMHQQMAPLLKEKSALRLQLMGKIATPGMQWEEISKLVDKINANNNQITTVFAKTQLQVFQKLGVLLPPPHKHHFKWQKRMG